MGGLHPPFWWFASSARAVFAFSARVVCIFRLGYPHHPSTYLDHELMPKNKRIIMEILGNMGTNADLGSGEVWGTFFH